MKNTKGFWIGENEVKLSLLAGDMISGMENPKESTKLLGLIDTFRKVSGYKINIQTSTVMLYT